MRTLASRRPDVTHTDAPGLVVIQLDGLSHDVLSHSLRAGRVPEMARWIRTGTHRLGHWNALLPSTTPASQAGILHGNNDGIPNFRWWEKKNKRLMVANHPEDATEIERRISNGEGLLSPGGASISNIFTGDGERAFLVMSTIKVKERGLGDSDAFSWFFVSPYNYITMIAKYIAEIDQGEHPVPAPGARGHRAPDAPRLPLSRRCAPPPTSRFGRSGTSLVVQEMLRGTPVIYMDYTDYDEIAHHSGPERPESLDALDGVDRELKTLLKASANAPRPYRFVILADHGQSLGATFLQRHGVTLQDVVRSLMGGSASVAAATAQIEDWGQLNTFLGEVSQTKGVTGSLARVATRNSTKDGQAGMGPADAQVTARGATAAPVEGQDGARTGQSDAKEDAKSVEPRGPHRGRGRQPRAHLLQRQRRATDPRGNRRAVSRPGRRPGQPSRRSACSSSVRRRTASSCRQARHPLPRRGPRRGRGPAGRLRRARGRGGQAPRRRSSIVGDIAVVSHFDPETQEIAAFEELIGAHGGLGGAQTRPFLLYPTDWELDLGPLMGAPMVYQQLRRWMESELGMTFGPQGTATTPEGCSGSRSTSPAAPTVPSTPSSSSS